MGVEIYHVMNRGVDKRTIVLDDRDRNRFVADLFAMNNADPVGNMNYHFARSMDTGCPYDESWGRERLVTIHGWALMKNHYHLLLSEEVEGGLAKFLHKFGMGYAKYFNERHKRQGVLFQGPAKKVLLKRDAHFLWILNYIHFNPLDYMKGVGDWRTQCLISSKKALEYLKKYRWSSYCDYLGEGKLSPILTGSFMYADRKSYMKEAKRYLDAIADAPISISLLD